MLHQSIDLPGIENARELGGYPIENKKIRKGVLFRTGKLGNASAETIDALKQYRIRKIIDFRMSGEVSTDPDPEIEGAECICIPVLEPQDIPGQSPELMAMYGNPNVDPMVLFNAIYEHGMLDRRFYVSFLMGERGRRGYHRFFQELLSLEDGSSVLWHCKDGKDRAGCGAMLLLYALGADRELVVKDYLLTNTYNAEKIKAHEETIRDYGLSEGKKKLYLFMKGAVSEEYMTYAIDTLDREFGSVTGYIREGLGISDSEIAELRRKYLV